MKQIGVQEFKDIQFIILKQFHNYCTLNDIHYSLGYGTLLGAIRHKGFIPWDDDIDVMLTRDQYNKLIKTFPPLIDEHYGLLSLERDKKWNRPYAKMYDKRTLIFERTAEQVEGQGIGIDIFPIDKISDNKIICSIINATGAFLNYMDIIKTLIWGHFNSRVKNIFLATFKALLYPVSKRSIAQMESYVAQFCQTKECTYSAYICEGLNARKKFRSDIFTSYTEALFEGERFESISDADTYLTAVYGDYMQLPPEEKRITHHAFKAYWK